MAGVNGHVVRSKKTPIERVIPYSKATPQRIAAMQAAVELIDQQGVQGDIVECGVWRGGHLILARLLSPTRRCWAYDTYCGMTEPGPEDVKRSGQKAQTTQLQNLTKRMPIGIGSRGSPGLR